MLAADGCIFDLCALTFLTHSHSQLQVRASPSTLNHDYRSKSLQIRNILTAGKHGSRPSLYDKKKYRSFTPRLCPNRQRAAAQSDDIWATTKMQKPQPFTPLTSTAVSYKHRIICRLLCLTSRRRHSEGNGQHSHLSPFCLASSRTRQDEKPTAQNIKWPRTNGIHSKPYSMSTFFRSLQFS